MSKKKCINPDTCKDVHEYLLNICLRLKEGRAVEPELVEDAMKLLIKAKTKYHLQ